MSKVRIFFQVMNAKRIVLIFLALSFFSCVGYAQQNSKVTKVVIDAGHGGKDPGCVGKRSYEKDIALKVALKLGKLITDNCKDVQVIYTRKTDVFVEVYRRAEIANNNHADLFISIHCNSVDSKTPRGVETYIMGLHKTEANLAVAKKENASILKEDNYSNNYGGFDPNSPEASVIFSLYSSAYLKNSASLASKVQKQLVTNTRLPDRKVQQAGFWVLYRVAMPSILVELGFLSNYEEESYLIKPLSHDIMAVSLFNAFVEYKNQQEGTSIPTLPLPVENEQEVKQEATTPPSSNTVETKTAPENNQEIYFRVQFYSSPNDISTAHKRFQSLQDVKKYHENNLWKYTCGNVQTYEEIQVLLKKIKSSYPDAFIIAFKGDTKIPVAEARALIKK